MTAIPRAFGICVDCGDQHAVIRVRGEVDLETAPILEARLLALARNGATVITVDMAETDFIDSTGLHALVVGLRTLRASGGDLVLRSPSRNAVRILQLSGLDTVVKVIA